MHQQNRNLNWRSVTLAITIFIVLFVLASTYSAWPANAQGTTAPPPGTAPPPPPPPPPPPDEDTGNILGDPLGPTGGPQPTTTNVGGGGTANSSGGDFRVTAPGTTPAGTNIVINPSVGPGPNAQPGGFQFAGHANQVIMNGPNNAPITGALSPPLTLTINYTPADLALAGGNPNNFVILMQDPVTGMWSQVGLSNLTINTATGQVSVNVNNLPFGAVFGLFVKTS